MFKKINSKLEQLFDQTPTPIFNIDPTLLEAKQKFQILDNNLMLENLSYIFTGDVTTENLSPLFSQLSSYFEIGYLFHRGTQEINLYGKNWLIPEGTKTFKLPNTPLYKIFKSEASGFLRHFKFQDLDPQKKMSSYLIKIADGHYFIFIDQTAEPWAKLKIESLQKTLMKINFNL